MTIIQLHPRPAVVRAAGLVDVPAVVRLFAAEEHPAADVDMGLNLDQARRAMRLMLAHYALEDGEVWVAERTDGRLLAAAVWLPPDTESPHARFGTLFSRELATRPPRNPLLPKLLKKAGPVEPHWTVITACTPDDTEVWAPALVTELLTPGLRAVDDDNATAVALTLTPHHMDQLRPLGFRHPHRIALAPSTGVWLTTRRPGRRVAA